MKKFKLKKLIVCTLLLVSVFTVNQVAANAEWIQNDKGWWYSEGNSWSIGWRVIDGYVYYFNGDGYMEDNRSRNFFDSAYGLNSSGQFTNVTINGDWAFCASNGKIVAYLGSESNINIPDKIDNITVTGIGSFAFSSSKATNITIPNTVSIIGVGAFSACKNLINITIPNSVKTICDHAFADCRGLTNITIPSSVTKMSNSIFSRCINLTNVTVENGINFLGNATFSECTKLTNITLPNTLTSIGQGTFVGCMSLKNITIPSGVTKIDDEAFYYCNNLTSLTLPNGLTEIGVSAFKDCTKLTSITIPDSLQSIDSQQKTPFNNIVEAPIFEGCNNVTIYTKSVNTKQLLVNSGVNPNKIIVTA